MLFRSALRADARPAEAALRKAIADRSVDVRIAAAEALAHVGGLDAAMPVLVEALGHEAMLVRLLALNVLDRLGDRARPALPAIRAATTDQKGPIADYVNRLAGYLPERIGRP